MARHCQLCPCSSSSTLSVSTTSVRLRPACPARVAALLMVATCCAIPFVTAKAQSACAHVKNGHLKVYNCFVHHNKAIENGGGFLVFTGKMTIVDSIFEGVSRAARPPDAASAVAVSHDCLHRSTAAGGGGLVLRAFALYAHVCFASHAVRQPRGQFGRSGGRKLRRGAHLRLHVSTQYGEAYAFSLQP